LEHEAHVVAPVIAYLPFGKARDVAAVHRNGTGSGDNHAAGTTYSEVS
jgi:hypothetical protein